MNGEVWLWFWESAGPMARERRTGRYARLLLPERITSLFVDLIHGSGSEHAKVHSAGPNVLKQAEQREPAKDDRCRGHEAGTRIQASSKRKSGSSRMRQPIMWSR